MKASIHPKWYADAKVTCACGNTFTVGATVPTIQVDVCSNCHPFYTGQIKFIDAAGRVDAFKTKMAGGTKDFVSKNERRKLKKQEEMAKELERPDTLEELREKLGTSN